MDEQASSKKPRIPPKVIKYIGIGVVLFGLITLLITGYMSKQERVNLIERAQTEERDSADDENPTPDVYKNNVSKVLHRSKSTTATLSMEIGDFENLLEKLPDSIEYSYYELQNFLGEDKLHVEFTLTDSETLKDAHTAVNSLCKEYLESYPAITRIYYTYQVLDTIIMRGYFENSDTFDTMNYTSSGDTELGTVLSSGSKEYDAIVAILDTFLTTDYKVSLSTDGTRYNLTVSSETIQSSSGTSDIIDIFDQIFFCIQNDFSLPVYLQIYEGTPIAVSGVINPTDGLFGEFYTDKPYYQDISRAEYYLCNEWLFGSIESALSSMLENII